MVLSNLSMCFINDTSSIKNSVLIGLAENIFTVVERWYKIVPFLAMTV